MKIWGSPEVVSVTIYVVEFGHITLGEMTWASKTGVLGFGLPGGNIIDTWIKPARSEYTKTSAP